MSKTWYPVIDYESCTECGACIGKCEFGVYKMEKNRPVVAYSEGCIEGCRGCQKICPVDAIEYIGDTGGKDNCSCGCCN